VIGEQSGHYLEVQEIATELNTSQFVLESLDAHQIASLLWQIFMDSRCFFLTGIDVRGNLPQLLLQMTYNKVAAGIVQTHLIVPCAQLQVMS
jgi:hypothetical protein